MVSSFLAAALAGLGLWASPAQGAVVVPAAPAVAPSSAAVEPGLLERAFDLDEAVHLALKNDSRLLSAEQDRIIAQQRLTEARLEFVPEFGLQVSAAKFDARYPTAFSPELGNVLAFPRGSLYNPSGAENIYSGRGYMNFPIYEGGRSVNALRIAQAALKQAHKILFRDGLTTSNALTRIEQEVPPLPEVQYLVQFVRSSERGIIK